MDNLSFDDGFSTTTFTNSEIPTQDAITQAFTGIGNELGDLMLNTGLEPILEQLSTRWTSQVHSLTGFHESRRDELAREIKELVSHQDGSEIQSNQLEDLTAECHHLDEVIDTLELIRDTMASNHHIMTGHAWRPHSGSKRTRHNATSAVLEARDYLDAQEKARAIEAAPKGTLVAVAGTANFDDIEQAFRVFDSCLEKYADMKIITGGNSRGIDKIASAWANARRIDIIVHRPEFKKHGAKRAPFMRNESVIAMKPKGVLVFINPQDANGVAMNLLQKAEAAGINGKRFVQAAL
tara:strand:+ start:39359 stop:40243 length:885 start_codon:yes stop_codon:yes gene_type:complete